MRNLFLVCAVAAAALLFTFAGASFADPPGQLPNVPPHRHFLMTPTGALIPIGPQICEHPELQQAFNEFHFNVHHSFIPGIGEIHTLGPQNGAPGLHNGLGAEIIARPCSFQP